MINYTKKGMMQVVEKIINTIKKGILAALVFYKKAISPLLPQACQFQPTCSEYMFQAVEKYGAVKGTFLGIKRLLRCQPFCKGGYDPVP